MYRIVNRCARARGCLCDFQMGGRAGLATDCCRHRAGVVILRPPLVYGPGVKANFQRLIHIVKRGWPLPLGAIRNRRSLLYLGNFVDAIRLCVEHPAAAGQIFLLDDGKPVSTPELIRAVARALGRPAHLLAVPVWMLEAAERLLASALQWRG